MYVRLASSVMGDDLSWHEASLLCELSLPSSVGRHSEYQYKLGSKRAHHEMLSATLDTCLRSDLLNTLKLFIHYFLLLVRGMVINLI